MKIAAINIDPAIMEGAPVFNGSRVPVESLFQWLETEKKFSRRSSKFLQ